MKNTAEFWEFAEGQMLDGLYWEYWYNTGSDKSVNFMMIFCDNREKYDLYCTIVIIDNR